MARERTDEPDIGRFIWDHHADGNVEHIARHGVTPSDVEEVKETEPHFFTPRPGRDGCVMVGPNSAGRFLFVAMVEGNEVGDWYVATAHWFNRRRAGRLYSRE